MSCDRCIDCNVTTHAEAHSTSTAKSWTKGQALSDDLRIRVVKASAAGMSARQSAARFGVGIPTAIRWIARANEGELISRPQGWRRSSAVDAREALVVALVEGRKDVTLNEMVERLSVERQVRISQSALGAWLRGHGWSFRKSPHALEQDRSDVLKRPARLVRWSARPRSRELIFIEARRTLPAEMASPRGRALRGERCASPE
ncbi:putative transposase [Rhizobium lusitanum]|uniref:Putative transposase n=1 Tax=Rhizobium lusitanum TaxID=293958 RepID=A0A7X0IWJ7_9HYPH|nr:putative transposase [Rhizobium lusitanum]